MYAVLQALNTSSDVPHKHFYAFDKVAYYLIKFEQEITLTAWTDLCHQLMRKVPFVRNEDLFYLYRRKVGTNLSHMTGAHLAKCVFILSRSQFPFEELLYRQLFNSAALERGIVDSF